MEVQLVGWETRYLAASHLCSSPPPHSTPPHSTSRYDGYPPHTGPGYENRAYLEGQASLNLTKVREEDQGWYECKVYFLNRPVKPKNGSWLQLEVNGELSRHVHSIFTANSFSPAPPHFKVKPPDILYVKVGEFLSLPCEAGGTPTPTITWSKVGPLFIRDENGQK